MNTNKNTSKKNTNTKNRRTVTKSENQRIKDAYNKWVKSGEPAIDVLNNTTLPQDPLKPYKRCYVGKDKTLRQLPKYWYIREDRTLISFKDKRAILSVPHVIHVNETMERPCFSFRVTTESGKETTKKITDYDLMTLVWHPERVYGNARRLLEESLIDNLGSREKARNKVHGHHCNGAEKDYDSVIMIDTPAHDFCHDAPRTDADLTEEERNKFISDLHTVAEQEPNKITMFIKDAGAEKGLLGAKKKQLINGKDLFELYEIKDKDGRLLGYIDLASIMLMRGYEIERVTDNEILIPYLKRLECQK